MRDYIPPNNNPIRGDNQFVDKFSRKNIYLPYNVNSDKTYSNFYENKR